MSKEELTLSMKSALARLYKISVLYDPFMPEIARGITRLNGSTARALIRRNLAMKTKFGYAITKAGIQLAEELGIDIFLPSRWKNPYDHFPEFAEAENAFNHYVKNVKEFNPAYCAEIWRNKSLELTMQSTSHWDRGGWIEDHDKRCRAEIYRYMSLLALEMALN